MSILYLDVIAQALLGGQGDHLVESIHQERLREPVMVRLVAYGNL